MKVGDLVQRKVSKGENDNINSMLIKMSGKYGLIVDVNELDPTCVIVYWAYSGNSYSISKLFLEVVNELGTKDERLEPCC